MDYKITKLETQISKVKRIFHIGDIHLRLLKRHDEYNVVFNKMFSKFSEIGLEDSIICILGDLVHSKVELSPELIRECSKFLKKCAELCPTILIAGNHDANLNNKNRLDSLTPIVDSLNLKDLFYLKDTGLYQFADCLFSNFSVFDHNNVEKYIKMTKVPKSIKRNASHLIGLFHGPLHNSITDVGYRVDNKSLCLDLFDGLHTVLCADIHKRQTLQTRDDLNDKPIVIYPGSLIQQNYGETLENHGFCSWDLTNQTHKFYDIDNDYGFCTLEIMNGKLISPLSTLTKNTRLRLKCTDTLPSEVKKILEKIQEKFNIEEVCYLKDSTIEKSRNNLNELKLEDVHNVEYQNSLIKQFLIQDSIDVDVLEEVCNINKEINLSIIKNDKAQNIKWIPKKFEFSNIFSYGENNVLDFSKMKDLIGLFSKNASGKSSLFHILSFCLFDKCSETSRTAKMMNTQKDTFKCKFNFLLNGEDYFIERIGKKDKKGNVKVDVSFYKIKNGNKLELNGEGRYSTNDVIRDYVGTFDDFILTSLSLQGGKSLSFIELGQTEKKDLLIKFMGIDVFDNLETCASKKLQEIILDLKKDNIEQLNQDSSDYSKNLEFLLENTVEIKEKLSIENDQLNNITTLIENENKKLIPLQYVPKKSLEQYKKDLVIKKENEISTLSSISENKNIEKQLSIEIEKLTIYKEKFEETNLLNNVTEYQNISKELEIKTHCFEKEKVIINSKIEKLKNLESHKYDPSCQYCIDNVFVKDAIKTREELITDKLRMSELINKLSELKNKKESFGDILEQYEKYKKLLEEINNKNKKQYLISNTLLKLQNELQSISSSVLNIESEINQYIQSEDNIKHNLIIEKNIVDLKNKRNVIKSTQTELNSLLYKNATKQSSIEDKIVYLKNRILEIGSLEKKKDCYELYISSISRNGIPNMLIERSVPKIQDEVNNILRQIVDFTLEIFIEDKDVYSNIVYEDKKSSLELGSGMEKFISSLTLRCAISNICHLPKSNFLVIDEGFGQLDSDHFQSIVTFFNFLKTQYEFIIIISHLEAMRELVDCQLEIKKEGSFSKIEYL